MIINIITYGNFYICISGVTLGVMVIVVGNIYGDPSSYVGRGIMHFTHPWEKV